MKPLKAVNLRSEKAEPYLACPHCLTEVTTEQPTTTIAAEAEQGENTSTSTERITQPKEDETSELQTVAKCAHHFGYLSERSSKESIPEECMICESMLNCMRKPARG